ncbi:hypothetical protein DMX06_01000 [Pseudomonas mosselii]|nr:hypothetical protein DMX06_01000 [Pseudomonas mosselii]
MVSVPRELTQMAADAIDDLLADDVSAVSAAAWVDIPQKLRALLAQPVEQHQGEPAWYMTENGLSATHAKMKALSDRQGWDTSDYSVPLYQHADPNVRWKAVADEQMQVISGLRAQLAERDVLLTEIEKRHWSGADFDLPADLVPRIKALSASA